VKEPKKRERHKAKDNRQRESRDNTTIYTTNFRLK
jgi:hypothetical protein